MSNISKMTGTPWHVNRFTREEDDERRHKSRCKYYSKATSICSYRHEKCYGSAHCSIYTEIDRTGSEQTFSVKKENSTSKQNKTIDVWTHGIRNIPMSEIIVSSSFSTPRQEKVEALTEYYHKYNKFDKPLLVSRYGNQVFLEDRFLRYYVAKQLNLKKIDAEMIPYDISNSVYYPSGCDVMHFKYGRGKVIESTKERITVAFALDNSEKIFIPQMCYEQNILERVVIKS